MIFNFSVKNLHTNYIRMAEHGKQFKNAFGVFLIFLIGGVKAIANVKWHMYFLKY